MFIALPESLPTAKSLTYKATLNQKETSMLKNVESFVSKLQTVVKIATATLCLVVLTSLPILSANASSMQPMASIGIKHQAEGAVKQGIGKAEQVTGDLKDKAKGLSNRIDGKAKRDIGRVESKAEKFANKNKKNATELGNQIKDGADSIADSVKDLAK
jgi:uncharacterized protein YjbJ (UPF0337 family)